MRDERWSLILHGGARTIATEHQEANRRGCRAAAKIGAKILGEGGSALDAVEQVVCALEDDPTFNAGTGSVPTLVGDVEMDAAIMDGTTLDIGAVAALPHVRNPVSVARLLLGEPTVLLVGEGARAFARAHGVAFHDVVSTAVREPQHDTVGCVAMDGTGAFAVATSTGGLTGQRPGRVGDAPIPGCGFYADDHAGGVAISGDGESILRALLASRVMDQLWRQPAAAAAGSALEQLARVGGKAGIVALDREGGFGISHNSAHFAVAIAASWLPDPVAGVHQSELEGHGLNG